MEARVAQEVVERPRHARVERQPVLARHAHAGVDFVRVIAGFVVALGRHRFGEMDARRVVAPGVQLPQRFVSRPARGVQMVDYLHDMILHALESADGRAELDARPRVFERHVEHRLRRADFVGAEYRDGFADRALERTPAAADFAQDGVRRDFRVLEDDFA